MPRPRSPRLQLSPSSICEECGKEVTDKKHFVFNNRKRHWNCAELLHEYIKKMEEAIENADDENAKENAKDNFRQLGLLAARMDVCEKHNQDYKCSFEMVGYKEELQERHQSLLDLQAAISQFRMPSDVGRDALHWVLQTIRSEKHRVRKLLE